MSSDCHSKLKFRSNLAFIRTAGGEKEHNLLTLLYKKKKKKKKMNLSLCIGLEIFYNCRRDEQHVQSRSIAIEHAVLTSAPQFYRDSSE